MKRGILLCVGSVVAMLCFWVVGSKIASAYEPPSEISREEIVKTNNAVLAMPDLKLRVVEDIFRIKALGLDWDVGVESMNLKTLRKCWLARRVKNWVSSCFMVDQQTTGSWSPLLWFLRGSLASR